MEIEVRSSPPASHVSLIQEDEDCHPQAIPMRIYRPGAQEMTPWLREEVATRRRQLKESRELDEAAKLCEEQFEMQQGRNDDQNDFVSEWLEGLPEKLVEGWETMLREAGERASSVMKHTSIIQDEVLEVDLGIGETGDEDDEKALFDDPEDEFLQKILLGRKRLMQAEISVKRLKMGLKHVTNGLCREFGDEAAAGRTRDLLAAVDTTFEEVVRTRLSSVTSSKQYTNGKENYRERLDRLRGRNRNFMRTIYSTKEISELKMMVADILSMDEQSGDTEGKQWFLRHLPRLLELREDMAEAENEAAGYHLREASNTSFPDRVEYLGRSRDDVNNPTVLADSDICDVSVWDLYYYQYLWLRVEHTFQPSGPWEAFDISPEEEIHTQDWELRIEQRIWLQENFSITTGGRIWSPFRLEMAVRQRMIMESF
ncbi:hypothetical protein EJ08DRAFT_448877 [Tothia fuscella]|uniref:Uncharacterized protein n=1 Tax=Tothia fuscella TaxID=1048955 RepID=A0A9P4NJM5_9PEZI|nr:hypothetical protein EJ08DRAFT_448877 [Tothia fuscella]